MCYNTHPLSFCNLILNKGEEEELRNYKFNIFN